MTIKTNLYSNLAYEALQSVDGQWSDGAYENSPRMERYWRFANVKTAPDGEVLIVIDDKTCYYDTYNRKYIVNGFNNMSEADVKRLFAGYLKRIMQLELKDENDHIGWKRDNQFETSYLSYDEKITVQDIYFIYEHLLGRDTAKKYPVMTITSVISTPKSEADTKAEEARRQKLDEINEACMDKIHALEAWKKTQLEQIEAEFLSKRQQISDEFKSMREAV